MSLSDAFLLVALLIVGWSMYRLHLDPANSFNILDLVMENGRVSRIALAFMVALFVTSWVLVLVARNGKTSMDVMFSAYGAMWVAPILAKLFSPPQPPTKTTTSTATQTEVETK